MNDFLRRTFRFLACCLLSSLRGRALLDRRDLLGPLSAEAPEVESLDELRQRRFPELLVVVGELTELPRVQPEFPRHLHMRMREAVALARLDPILEFRRELLLRHTLSVSDSAGDLLEERAIDSLNSINVLAIL